jgi:hypothetical protein
MRILDRLVLVFAVTAMSVLGGSSLSTAATEPPGTRTLQEGLTDTPLIMRLAGASAEAILAERYRDAFGEFVLLPSGGAPQVIDTAGTLPTLQGSMIAGLDFKSATVWYRTVDGSITGERAVPDGWQFEYVVTPTGWIEVNEARTEWVAVTAATGDRIPVPQPIGGFGCCPQISAGDTGLLALWEAASAPNYVVGYLAYGSSSWVQLDVGSTGSEYASLGALQGGVAAWTVEDYATTGLEVRWRPVSLATPTQSAPAGAGFAEPVVVNGGAPSARVYWRSATDEIRYVSASAPQPPTAIPVTGVGQLASDGASILLTRTVDDLAVDGLWSLTPPATDVEPVLLAGAAPLQSRRVAVGAGRAAWSSNLDGTWDAWQRSVSRTGDELTLGDAGLLASNATSYGLSISGRRTTWVGDDNDRTLHVDVGGSDEVLVVAPDSFPGFRPDISGLRVVASSLSGSVASLFDLANSSSQPLPAGTSHALWGDVLAYVNESGSVVTRPADGGEESVVYTPPDGESVPVVDVSHDYVAWAICDASAFICDQIGLRAFRDETSLVETLLADLGFSPRLVLSGSYLAFSEATNGLQTLNLRTRSVNTLGPAFEFDLDGNIVGWVDNGSPKVTPLSHEAIPPRYLGNGIAPQTYDTTDGTWDAEWVVTKPLPTCSVEIADGTSTVRTLDCSNSDGSAMVSWDGNDGSGARVQSGTYTWTLTGSDADGPLLATDGSPSPIIGTIEVVSTTPGRATPADFDADGSSDLAVFRPTSGGWFVEGQPTEFYGLAGDVPVAADYDGDLAADRAVYRPASGGWFVDGAAAPVFLGLSSDVPVPSDYNGDGLAERAVWRPGSGAWFIEGAPTGFLGQAGDVPVPADYDGDGAAELAVWRPSSGAWFIEGAAAPVFVGGAGDVPVVGDYDGDGLDDPAIWRPGAGGWYVDGSGTTVFLGLAGDRPVPGDYDGDAATDRAVWRPSTGAWFIEAAPSPSFLGLSSDVPAIVPPAVLSYLP